MPSGTKFFSSKLRNWKNFHSKFQNFNHILTHPPPGFHHLRHFCLSLKLRNGQLCASRPIRTPSGVILLIYLCFQPRVKIASPILGLRAVYISKFDTPFGTQMCRLNDSSFKKSPFCQIRALGKIIQPYKYYFLTQM